MKQLAESMDTSVYKSKVNVNLSKSYDICVKELGHACVGNRPTISARMEIGLLSENDVWRPTCIRMGKHDPQCRAGTPCDRLPKRMKGFRIGLNEM